MNREELLEELKRLTQKETTLSSLCETLKLSEYEVLGLVRELRTDGINILTKKHDDDIYLYTGITSVGGDQSNIGFIFKAFPKKASTLDNLPPLAK